MKNGTSIGLTEQPTYVEPLDNGSYGLCEESKAKGIAWEGKVYALEDRGGMEDLEAVSLVQTDAGQVLRSQNEVQSILFVIGAEQGAVDDATAAEHTELFAPWASGVSYIAGNIRRYGGALYRCVQAHKSQDDWTPDSGLRWPIPRRSGPPGASPSAPTTPTLSAQRCRTRTSTGSPPSTTTCGSPERTAGR